MSELPDPKATQRALAGIGVLVTRPAHQADPLCALIEAAGGRALRFPTLEIGDPPDCVTARTALSQIDAYDVVIFISANAVDKAMQFRAARDWPTRPRRMAVGTATARALIRHNLPVASPPAAPFDTSALLTEPTLRAVSGQRIAIVRGVGGRELLGTTLRARGARVDYIEVYQRVRPKLDSRDILQAWSEGAIDVITAASTETLDNLVDMIGVQGRSRLFAAPLVVISARMMQHALELGFTRPPQLAAAASDDAIVAAIIAWRRAATAGESE